jgi:hypothetical protein
MNKIIITLVFLLLIVGMVGATMSIKDFTKKGSLKEISSKKLCEKENNSNIKYKKCKVTEKKIKLKEKGLTIEVLENNDGEEVLKVYAK